MKQFKIDKESELHKQMQDLFSRMDGCKIALMALAKTAIKTAFGQERYDDIIKEHSDKIEYYGNPHVLAGGFCGVYIPEITYRDWKDTDWVQMSSRQSSVKRPKKTDKKYKSFWKSVKELPKVEEAELNELLNYSPTFKGMTMYSFPGVQRNEDGQWLFTIKADPDGGYTAPEGAIEILGSEYDELTKPKEKAAC